jgi:hypothetical protein
MVAQLDDESMRVVVEGPDYRSRGPETQSSPPALVGCSIEQANKYDHKRHSATMWKHVPEMLFEWDFIVYRKMGAVFACTPITRSQSLRVNLGSQRRTTKSPPLAWAEQVEQALSRGW